MKGNLFLVDWNSTAAAAHADALRKEGWDVAVESTDGGEAYAAIQRSSPDVVLIDLSSKPSHGVETARSLRDSKRTKSTPILFLGGSPNDHERVRSRVVDAAFCDWTTLSKVLNGLRPTSAPSPAPAPPRRSSRRRRPTSTR